jgi:hypothetical protein
MSFYLARDQNEPRQRERNVGEVAAEFNNIAQEIYAHYFKILNGLVVVDERAERRQIKYTTAHQIKHHQAAID